MNEICSLNLTALADALQKERDRCRRSHPRLPRPHRRH